MKNKIVIFLLVSLLSAGCNFFKKPAAGGIVKTINGGADWQFINAYKTNKDATMAGLNISTMHFDPQEHETVFAGSYNGGLYKYKASDNAWTKILSKIYVYDFFVHPQNSGIIYAAGVFDTKGRVLKTADGGASWQEVYNEASDSNPVRTIAYNPSNPAQIYIGTESGTIVRSADGGQTWQLVRNFSDRVNRIIWTNGGIYALFKTKGLYKAPGWGQEFADLSASLTKPEFSASNVTFNSQIEAFSQFYVDLLSSSLIYVTTNAGLYKTVDEGKTWTKMPLPVKPNQSYARGIAISQTSSNLVYTSVDATVYKSTDGGLSWQTQAIATNGLINYILIDPTMPQIVYGGLYVNQ